MTGADITLFTVILTIMANLIARIQIFTPIAAIVARASTILSTIFAFFDFIFTPITDFVTSIELPTFLTAHVPVAPIISCLPILLIFTIFTVWLLFCFFEVLLTDIALFTAFYTRIAGAYFVSLPALAINAARANYVLWALINFVKGRIRNF